MATNEKEDHDQGRQGKEVSGEETCDSTTVDIGKMKEMIKNLEAARGNGTSLISLIIRPTDQIAKIAKMMIDEYGCGSCIKSRRTRLTFLTAITQVQQILKLYKTIPTNGLAIYCGTTITDEDKEEKVSTHFEPFRTINTSLYLCDNKFHTEALSALLSDTDKVGFIVIDGNGALFGTLSGNTREVLHKFTADLPKRGDSEYHHLSELNFARQRLEKRYNYIRKTAAFAVKMFISDDEPDIDGLVLSGSADFKTELVQCDMFDSRLKAKVIKTVYLSYGGEEGFDQAIELASDVLSNTEFRQEEKPIDVKMPKQDTDEQIKD